MPLQTAAPRYLLTLCWEAEHKADLVLLLTTSPLELPQGRSATNVRPAMPDRPALIALRWPCKGPDLRARDCKGSVG